jgi:hypothetical protein
VQTEEREEKHAEQESLGRQRLYEDGTGQEGRRACVVERG